MWFERLMADNAEFSLYLGQSLCRQFSSTIHAQVHFTSSFLLVASTAVAPPVPPVYASRCSFGTAAAAAAAAEQPQVFKPSETRHVV
jgi:hypothetical protein